MNKVAIIQKTHKDFMEGGASWEILKETRYPSSKEAGILKEFDIPFDVDPEIRLLVIELNSMGIRTQGSCAGHRDRGFITFDPNITREDKEQIIGIARKYGLRNPRFQKVRNKTTGEVDWMALKFKPFGKTLQKRK